MELQKKRKPNVAIIGDVGINKILLELEETPQPESNSETAGQETKRSRPNWKNMAVRGSFKLSADALLVEEMLTAGLTGNDCNILSYASNAQASGAVIDKDDQSILVSLATAEQEEDNTGYYLKNFLGYTGRGPKDGVPEFCREFNRNFSSNLDGENDILVIDDGGNGFRDCPEAWDNIIKTASANPNILVIYKMSRPLFSGKLWAAFSQTKLPERTLLIIHANELREEGVNISRKLSWDRTISDFINKLPAYKNYAELQKCHHVLVRVGQEGVVYFHGGLDLESPYHPGDEENHSPGVTVCYLPNSCEDDLKETSPGDYYELASLFSGLLALSFTPKANGQNDKPKTFKEKTEKGIVFTMQSILKIVKTGYILSGSNFHHDFFPDGNGNDPVRKIEIDMAYFTKESDEEKQDNWSILSDQTAKKTDIDIAMKYIITGNVDELNKVPAARFKKLRTFDKDEIESFRSIRNLIREYFYDTKTMRPLSIAVFGPPGSGKSFAVKQVAFSVIKQKATPILEYNMSQFESPHELARAFHEIRDYTLKGETPLVFFDEFDAVFQKPLGWLKYFLAPMQDGEFKEGEKTHPIGRAIFVFAGGTRETLEAFSLNGGDMKSFIQSKGPDFISRLRGYVNILGPNSKNLRDRFYIIRRAVLLRALLMMQTKIVNKDDEINIDKDVLRALLVIPEYKHGSRSVEAILNMSMLSDRENFEKASLPSPEQLNLHLDGHVFTEMVDRDLFQRSLEEKLARKIHEYYVRYKKSSKTVKLTPAMRPWENLDNEYKESNRKQAYDLLIKLLRINCYLRPKLAEQEKPPFQLNQNEVEILARMEHKRYVQERLEKGWKPGKEVNRPDKIHDSLVPWSQLKKEYRDNARNIVRDIPKILDELNYELYRLDEKPDEAPKSNGHNEFFLQ